MLFQNTFYIGVTLLVFVGRGGLLLCCVVFRLLAWHSVMETTMVEPVWQGAFTPWHQTWHRAHPGFSAAQLGFPINPPSPLILFTPSQSVSPPLKLEFLPTVLLFSSLCISHFLCLYPCLLFISPPVSPLNFILSFAPQRQPFTHGTWRRTKRPLKMQSLHRNAIAVWISAFLLTSPELLCVSRLLRVHYFPLPLCGRDLDGAVEGSCWLRAQRKE